MTLYRCLGIVLLAHCLNALAQDIRPVGEGGRLFGQPDVEQLLARPYGPGVPMASSGECLWAAHPEGWGFENGTHYYLLTGRGVGFGLDFQALGVDIPAQPGTAYPSHVGIHGGSEHVSVDGAKWITQDDVLAAAYRVSNVSQDPVRVHARLRLPEKLVRLETNRATWFIEHAGMTVRLMAAAPGFAEAARTRPAPRVFHTEAESPVEQQGSESRDFKRAASGGQVLGSQFGGDEGDYAVWEIKVEEPIDDAVLSIRYARADEGSGDYRVTLGKKRAEGYGFKSTGGWGAHDSDFGVAAFPLGPVKPGPFRVRIVAVGPKCNVNFEVLSIHPSTHSFTPPDREDTVLERELELAPGASEWVRVFVGASSNPRKVEAALDRVTLLEDPLADQRAQFNRWLTLNVPAFRGDETYMRMYWHRAVNVLKKNLFRAGEGRLPGWAFSEGRWNSEWYPNMISYGAGHHVREARWLRDPVYVRDYLSAWCANAKEDGVFPNYVRPHEIGRGQYTDWITSTAWDAHCVHPSLDALHSWSPALKKNVDGWLAVRDADGDGLLNVDSHWWTGMEWQPSFFAFNGFNAKEQGQHLERVDLTSYVFGSAQNLTRILAAVGDSAGAAHYAEAAEKMRAALLQHMWDPETNFFYSIDPESHRKAMVKEVVGVYPFYFGMIPPDSGADFAEVWRSILDPGEFWTQWPVASATKRNPAYSQDAYFNGQKATICMWNGPTWPHANSIVLSAMAETLREHRNPPLLVNHFNVLFQSYTVAQFEGQDAAAPFTGEYYNGDTAEWRTEERDYNHSTWIDILIADIAGLRPRPDNVLELRPLIEPGSARFLVDGIRYHGHDITLAWNDPLLDHPSEDGRKGYRCYVDGRLVFHAESTPAVRPGEAVFTMTLE